MREVEGFESIGSVLKRILCEQGIVFDEREKTPEEQLEDSRLSCQRRCDWENSQVGKMNEVDGYDCPICKNKGYTVVPTLYLNRYEGVQSTCKCDRIRRTIMSLKRSGLEDLVKEYRFDTFNATEPWQRNALDMAKLYTENYKDNWLFIGGASGRGKTHLCTAAAIALLKKGNEVKYMMWRDEARRLKSIVNDPQYNEDIYHYKTVDVLYIDDLFKTGRKGNEAQRPTEADINLAFEIINCRAMQRKPTIISSECDIYQLFEIDEAIGGRIKQRCRDYCLNIGAKNTTNFRME
jgi:DNA replication protein DnaC